MKRFFTILSVTLAALAGLGSCKVMEEPQQIDALGQHSACFNGRVAELVDGTAETKGLSLVALPDWRKTAEANIHLYENGNLGKNPQMDIDPEDNRVAYFTATFSGSGVQPYKYNAVIAPADESGAFVVPAVQYPDSEKIVEVEGSGVSLIDPDADFLIGKTIQSDASYSSEDPVNLEFVRPVSLFRLAIVGLNKEEKIQEVALNTVETLTGKVNISDIDFETGAATFDKSEGSNTVTLKYNDASPKIIFYAYYVVCPTETAFNTLAVKTDKATYTKTFTSGSKVKFASGTFHSIAVDMSDAQRVEDEPEATKFYKVDKLAAGEEGLIVSNGYAMQNNGGALAAYEVTPSNGEIEIPGNVLESVVWSVSDDLSDTSYGPFTISNDGNYINVVKTGSTYNPTYSLGFSSKPSSEDGYYGWKYADDRITNGKNATYTRYLYCNGGTFAVDSENAQSATFYSKTKPKTSRNLAFAEASVSKNVSDAKFTNTLSGEKDGVTYSSSEPSVATVDANGEVTIVAAGSTTITASADETDAYMAGEASYTLTVVEVSTYTKITKVGDLNETDTYIIVNTDADKAFTAILSGDGKTFVWKETSNAVNVVSENGRITSGELAACEFKLKKKATSTGDYYLNFISAGKYLTIGESAFNAVDEASGSTTITANSSGQFTLKNSSKYYFRYSDSGYFYTLKYDSSVLIFKKDSGSTPTPPAPANVTYTKVSANTGTLEAGTYLIVNKDNTRALSGTTTSGNTNYVTVTPSDNVITGDYSANEFTISVSGSNYTIKNASGQYLYCNTDQRDSYLGYRSSANNFTLEKSDTYTDRFYFRTSKSGSDAEYLYYDATNNRNFFKIGGSGTPVVDKEHTETKVAAAGVYLYKLDGY